MIESFENYIQGKGRKDLTLLFKEKDAFEWVVNEMVKPFASSGITKVVGLDALGFVFVSPVAMKLNTGFALLRKGGKVPVEKESISFTDYSGTEKTFEIASNAIDKGDKVLIVDEWSETGAQMKAAISLLEKIGAEVIGFTCFNVDENVENDPDLANYKIHSVW